MSVVETPLEKGARLISYFQAVIVNLASIELSRQEALASESRALSELQYFSGAQMLNPQNIPAINNNEIAKTSVDAHIKKVQAEQIEQMGKIQIAGADAEAAELYIGKKVTVFSGNKDNGAIESIWFSPSKGYSTSEVKTHKVAGIIKEVNLESNTLLIEPLAFAKLIDPGRKFFMIRIIDPQSLTPLVSLEVA